MRSPAASPIPPGAAPSSPPAPGSPASGTEGDQVRRLRVALLGNPNTGKTTLFNRLTGLRHKTANFPGTTLEARVGRVLVTHAATQARAETHIELVDLPGVYSLELDQLEAQVARDALSGRVHGASRGALREPDAVCVVLDAANLLRNLRLAGEAMRRRLPTVVAINMIDLARKRGLHIDPAVLGEHLGCEVVLCNARGGEGAAELREALARARVPSRTPPGDEDKLTLWAQELYALAASSPGGGGHVEIGSTKTDRADRIAAHPVLGMLVFAAIMTALFYTIFSVARWPMDLISQATDAAADWLGAVLPSGLLSDLLTGGVIPGVGTILIFLPQICLLFFLISLLEDTGYLARGAFLMDRLLRPFGLPGHAFVPLLSSHACALPGIIACRAVPDPKERLATILVAPFMSCSARLPVYALLTGILFPDSPALAALAFVGCYALGALAGVLSALVARRTILRGKSRPMALELPSYKWPSLRTALITTWDRGLVFVKNAGTNILAICIILWWLGAFPRMQAPPRIEELREQAVALAPANQAQADAVSAEADRLEHQAARAQKADSFLGRLGRTAQPALQPLGYDWQLTVGVIASFAAREVFASTMAVVTTGIEDAEDQGVLDQIAAAKRDDGVTPIFTRPVAWSLLVYYVLAMQCLPTLVVTAREAGGVKWALLQFAWMSGLAYVAAMLTFHLAS
jgi:ferrous iron transport protein B